MFTGSSAGACPWARRRRDPGADDDIGEGRAMTTTGSRRKRLTTEQAQTRRFQIVGGQARKGSPPALPARLALWQIARAGFRLWGSYHAPCGSDCLQRDAGVPYDRIG